MPSPFPGMDPWLEPNPTWYGFHVSVIYLSAEMLLPQLRPRGYLVDKGERIWIEESERSVHPDVAVVERPGRRERPGGVAVVEADEPVRVHAFPSEFREPYLEIFDTEGRRLITSIEFLSPTNKRTTEGRKLFEQKRRELRHGGVNLVEIDLQRGGRHLVCVPARHVKRLKPWDYLVCLWRPNQEDEFEVYPIRLRDRLPRIRIPLKSGEDDVVLDLQAVVKRAYETGPYPDRLDYNADPKPSLSPDDAVWADAILRQAGLRTTPASSAS